MNQYQFTIGTTPKNIIGALNWNANWTLGSLAITDPFNSSDAQTCSYSYDSLARLTGANCGSIWGQTFTYDAFGNISKSGSISFLSTYYPITNGNGNPTNNREQTVSSCAPTYDANGNLTTDCTFMPYPYTYAWDADGNITGINLSNNYPPISIIYDAFDRAVQEDKSGTYSEILYSPIGKTGLMANQTANNVFIPLPGGEQATYTNSTLRYRHYDWLGSARAESAATPPLVGDVAYAPFGEPYSPDPSSPMYMSFTGQQPDTTSTGQDTTPPGLYDFPYREYNPTHGRWISPDRAGPSAVDPTTPQTWNRYIYVLNNPLRAIDPLGLDCVYYNLDGSTTTLKGDCIDDNDDGYYVDCDGCLLTSNSADVNGEAPDANTTDSLQPDVIAPGGCKTAGSSASTPGSTGLAAFSNWVNGVGSAGLMTGQFAMGLGPINLTYAPDSMQSQMMAASPGVTDAVNTYLSTGQANGLYDFGVSQVLAAGINPIQQFVGSYTYNIQPVEGGLFVTLTNYTSLWSLLAHQVKSHQRSSFRRFGTTKQTYQVTVPCG